jgi:AraC-like DNA-binding protein
MNDAVFFRNFRFNEFLFNETQHRDNSRGVDYHYIGLMKHGRGRILSEGQTLEIGEGEMFYIPKGLKYHSWWNTGGEGAVYDSIGFSEFPIQNSGGFMLQKIVRNEEIDRLFKPLSDDKSVNCRSIGVLYSLLGLLEDKLSQVARSKENEISENLLRLMNKDHRLAVAEYAKKLCISEAALYLYTKKAFGKTPNRLRQEVCCNKAVELLKTTDYSVEHISDACGFSSASYFRKVLRAVLGKSPSEIRKGTRLI